MSFPSALQSFVFYLVACTPCAKVRHRHKARQKAKRDRQEKSQFESDQPDVYRHPSPFHTNPFWSEEISMGPSLPKKSSSKDSSQRRLASSAGSSSLAPVPSLSDSYASLCASSAKVPPPLIGLSKEASSLDDLPDNDWNTKRYQREDEDLWGNWPGQRWMEAIVKAGSSAGRLIEATLGIEKPTAATLPPSPGSGASIASVSDAGGGNFYFYPLKNPPVNDYHPPVVSSRPAHPDAHRWMLQPPPPAKVMEGKVPVHHTATADMISPKFDTNRASRTGVAARPPPSPLDSVWINGTPSEAELIESLIGPRPSPARRSPSGRANSFPDDSASSSSDRPRGDPRRNRLSVRRSVRTKPSRSPVKLVHAQDHDRREPDDRSHDAKDSRSLPRNGRSQASGDSSDNSEDDGAAPVRCGRRPGHAYVLQRPKLDTIVSFIGLDPRSRSDV